MLRDETRGSSTSVLDGIYLRLDTANNPLTGNLTIGNGAAGIDYILKFDGESNDLTMTWGEDEQRMTFLSSGSYTQMVVGNPSAILNTFLSFLTTSVFGVSGPQSIGFMDSHTDDGLGGTFIMMQDTGSSVSDGSTIATFYFGGNSNGGLAIGAAIQAWAEEDWSGGNGTQIIFSTAKNGGDGAVAAVAIKNNHRLTVGDVDESYPFFLSDETKFFVNNQVTSIDNLIAILDTTNFSINPDGNTNTGANTFALYAGKGFNATAIGAVNYNGGLPIGSQTLYNTSVIGAFGQCNYFGTGGTFDGGTGSLCTAAHGGYGGAAGFLVGGMFDANTSDDLNLGTPTGSVTNLIGGLFTSGVQGVSATNAVSGYFLEPLDYSAIGSTITNRIANYVDGTFGIARSDVATAASITNMAMTSSFIRMTGSTATALHGIHADTYSKHLTIYNVSSATVTLKNQSGTEGTAANRIITNTGLDVLILTGKSVIFHYDTAQSRWIHLINS